MSLTVMQLDPVGNREFVFDWFAKPRRNWLLPIGVCGGWDCCCCRDGKGISSRGFSTFTGKLESADAKEFMEVADPAVNIKEVVKFIISNHLVLPLSVL